MAPTFSLIMSTLGRTREPEFLLDSMAASTMTDFEVIVTIQNEDGSLNDPDKTRDYLGERRSTGL